MTTRDQRRSFLARLEPEFRRHAPKCTLKYGQSSIFPETCLTVDVPERADHLLVTALTLVGNTKIYGDPFPGDGRPHWEMWEIDEQGRLGERVISCRIDSIVSAFEAWVRRGDAEPPLQGPPAATTHLKKLAACVDVPWEVLLEVPSSKALSSEERRRLKLDIESLSFSRIGHLFPRDDEGRPVPKTAVLLEAYGPEVSRGRRHWLHVVATGTKRATKLAIGVEALIGENHEHRWNGSRWMWDAREAVPKPDSRWGIPGGKGAKTRVERCLDALDHGRIGEALEAYGVGWTPEVAKVLAGHPLSMNDIGLAERWAVDLHRTLTELAPWKLEGAAEETPCRLFTLPGQRHQRKASLMLARVDRAPVLTIEYTGTNARLPAILWKRTPWQDLVRHGLISPSLPKDAKCEPTTKTSPKVDEDDVAQKLADKLRSGSPSRYDSCLKLGRQLSPMRAAEVFLQALKSEDSDLRRLALELGWALRLAELAPVALKALKDDSENVRRAAAALVRRVGYEPALDVIAEQVVTDPSFFLDGAASLRGWGDKVGVASFEVLLASENPAVRAAVCLALVQYGGKALAPALVELAQRDVPMVAGAALHALGSLDDELRSKAADLVKARADSAAVAAEARRFQRYRRI